MKEGKPQSLTQLMQIRGRDREAVTFLRTLVKMGFAEEIEYLSTSGSGELKKFKSLTEYGLKYGINKTTRHQFKTECRFFDSSFDELNSLVDKYKYDTELKDLGLEDY